MFSALKALSAMRTLTQAWTQMKRSGQFHPIPFFSFFAIIDMQDPYFTSHNIYFFKILNNKYLTARVNLTLEASLPSKEFTEVRVPKKLKETTVYLVC